MKLSLVVASGVHQGKVIPVSGSEFRIGRDPDCQLRPASPSISKRHCAIEIREESAFIRDIGSTNGTFVNDEQIAGEIELKAGDLLKAGPLEFTVKIEVGVGSKSALKLPPLAVAEAAKPLTVAVMSGDGTHDADAMAMLMLSDGDEPSSFNAANAPTAENMIPDGTTIMEIPAVPGEKKDEKKSKGFNADTSSAANAILSKYLRRPRT